MIRLIALRKELLINISTKLNATVPDMQPRYPQFSSYPNALTKCNININETTDAVILPSCKTSVLSSLTDNYTQTQYAKYLNNSKYTGYGIGSEDNWIIVVLSTSTASGDFTSQNAGTVLHQAGMVYYLVFLLFGVLFVFI